MKRTLKALASLFLVISLGLGAWASLRSMTTWSVTSTDLARVLQQPSLWHPFGFDSLGRDLLWRSLEGLFSSFVLGVSAAVISGVIGISLGAVAGLRGGLVDMILMRVIDVLEALPNLLMSAVLLLVWRIVAPDDGAGLQFLGLALALGFTGWLDLARQMRALSLRERSMMYMEAAVALGASRVRLVARHLWPNIKSSLWLLLFLQIPGFVLFEATLSFFGLGLRSPQVSLGQILLEGWKLLTYSSHVITGPTTLLFLTLVSFQTLLWDDSRQSLRTSQLSIRQRLAQGSPPPKV